jgi:hypothetical protein
MRFGRELLSGELPIKVLILYSEEAHIATNPAPKETKASQLIIKQILMPACSR